MTNVVSHLIAKRAEMAGDYALAFPDIDCLMLGLCLK